MSVTNNTYNNQANSATNWNQILNALPKAQRRQYKEANIAQVNRQYAGTQMYRVLNIYGNTHSPTSGHPWESSSVSSVNLVGRWMLNEGYGNVANDTSGGTDSGAWSGTASGSNGTYYTSGVTSAYAGIFSNDGTTKVALASPAALAGNTSKSMTLWFNSSNLSTTREQDIAEFGSNANASTFGISINNGGQVVGHVGGTADLASGVNPTANSWYFAALTYDSTKANLSIYVNGNLAKSGTVPLTTGSANFFFGQHLTSSTSYFVGSVDDVRIYNVALSTSNVQAIYNKLA